VDKKMNDKIIEILTPVGKYAINFLMIKNTAKAVWKKTGAKLVKKIATKAAAGKAVTTAALKSAKIPAALGTGAAAVTKVVGGIIKFPPAILALAGWAAVEVSGQIFWKTSPTMAVLGAVTNGFTSLGKKLTKKREDGTITAEEDVLLTVLESEDFGEGLYYFTQSHGAKIENFHDVINTIIRHDMSADELNESLEMSDSYDMMAEHLSVLLDDGYSNTETQGIVDAIVMAILANDIDAYMINIMRLAVEQPGFPATLKSAFDSLLMVENPGWWRELDSSLWVDALVFEDSVKHLWSLMINDASVRKHINGLEEYLGLHHDRMMQTGVITPKAYY